jgi:hypothetical protein
MSWEQYEQVRREVESCPPVRIVMPSDLLLLPPSVKAVLTPAYREGKVSLLELAQGFGLELVEADAIAGLLVQKGYLRQAVAEPGPLFIARFGGHGSRSGTSPLDKL